MNIFFYTIIFVIGIFFGSFFTLAVYRIPRKEDILIKHSYCPNCNHKLGFFELIPVLSYIFLRGKCKSCKQSIRIRYLVLEILSGLLFVAFAKLLKLDILNLDLNSLIFFIFTIFYMVAIILIAGIDKEYRRIEKSVLLYGIIVSSIYNIYLCVTDGTIIYRYVIYLIAFIIAYLTNTYELKKKNEERYTLSIIMLMILVAISVNEVTSILAGAMTMIAIVFYNIISKFKDGRFNKAIHKDINFGFIFCVSSVIIFMLQLLIINYIN